jgi:hypothetical protein
MILTFLFSTYNEIVPQEVNVVGKQAINWRDKFSKINEKEERKDNKIYQKGIENRKR